MVSPTARREAVGWLQTRGTSVRRGLSRHRPESCDVGLRMQSLLEDRFRLVAHRETRELPAYVLVSGHPDGKLGDRLRRHRGECGVPDRQPPSGQSCGTNMNMAPTVARVTGRGIPMKTFARNLSGATGRYVVDQTCLAGLFDLDLEFAPEQSADTQGASLFTAIQEQLGLKLDARRAPVEVLVIDSVAQPIPD
jgi:uncharacterized protein (TIGR03435 family)